MARPGAVMNSTSAELVSIQALWPASAAASAFVFTSSSVGGAGVSVASAMLPRRQPLLLGHVPSFVASTRNEDAGDRHRKHQGFVRTIQWKVP